MPKPHLISFGRAQHHGAQETDLAPPPISRYWQALRLLISASIFACILLSAPATNAGDLFFVWGSQAYEPSNIRVYDGDAWPFELHFLPYLKATNKYGPLTAYEMTASQDGRYLYAIERDTGKLVQIETSTGIVTPEPLTYGPPDGAFFKHPTRPELYFPAGRFIRVWNLIDKRVQENLIDDKGTPANSYDDPVVYEMTMTSDGSAIYAATLEGGSTSFYRIPTDTWKSERNPLKDSATAVAFNSGLVSQIASGIFPQGEITVTAFEANTRVYVNIYRNRVMVRSPINVPLSSPPFNLVYRIVFAPDGTYFLLAHGSGVYRIPTTNTGFVKSVNLGGYGTDTRDIAVAGDKLYILMVNWIAQIALKDIDNDVLFDSIQSFSTGEDPRSLIVVPDGRGLPPSILAAILRTMQD